VTPFDIGKMVGIFAAIGLAIGALTAALSQFVKQIMALPWWQVPLAILAVMIIISGPSVIMTFLKLRQRTLGPVLEACGWAINGRVKITLALGSYLTDLARLPPNSKRKLDDPFEDRHPALKWTAIILGLLILAAIAFYFFIPNPYFHRQPKEAPVPAAVAPAPAAAPAPAPTP
jgi:Na+/melibiose symporter-like transporter